MQENDMFRRVGLHIDKAMTGRGRANHSSYKYVPNKQGGNDWIGLQLNLAIFTKSSL